jgi:hypothetical protein
LAIKSADVEEVDLLDGALRGVYDFMEGGPSLLWGLALLTLVAIPLTFLHEWGHALVAHDRLGVPVLISVGEAGRFAQFRLGQIDVSLSLFSRPSGVGGFAAFDPSRASATDVFWIALGGPMMSLTVLMVSLVLYSAAPASGPAHDIAWAMVLDGVFAAINLVPMRLRDGHDGPILETDGRVALDAARLARAGL